MSPMIKPGLFDTVDKPIGGRVGGGFLVIPRKGILASVKGSGHFIYLRKRELQALAKSARCDVSLSVPP